jgi:hypothetical protein
MLTKDPGSGLLLPREFVNQKVALKKTIDDLVDQAINDNNHLKHSYFLVLHMKFSPQNPEEFHITPPKVTTELPPFTSNQMVFWVNPMKSICEILWMVRPKKKGEKLQVDFNKSGVAYLQAKGAMATSHQRS